MVDVSGRRYARISTEESSCQPKKGVQVGCPRYQLQNGYAWHKSAFRDPLCLRYGWHPSNLPLQCTCGKQFSVEHAPSCSHGGFPSIRHNELRDITADLMSEVSHNVGTEPPLQPITDEHLIHRTANREDGACLNLAAERFWAGVM